MWHSIVLLCVLSISKVCGSCPDNWVGHGPSCYHFSHDMEQWADAMVICKVLGGYLVEIDSDSENNFVRNNLRYDSAWMGASDLLEEGVWEWMTSHNTIEYSAWQPGEPNNVAGSENCAVVNKGTVNYGWNDDACSKQLSYVCEQNTSSEVIIG